MRTLCVADEFAWPANTGYRIRLDNILRVLAGLGPVDYLAILNDDREADLSSVPADLGFERVRIVRSHSERRRVASVARAVAGRLPRRIVWPDWDEAREALGEWVETPYDLVWFGHADAYAAVGGALDGPVVVDLDNLEGSALRERRTARPFDPTRAGVRRRVADAFDRLDEIRWNRLERRIARTVAATVVCSEIDRRRLAVPGVAIVPNGYEAARDPALRERWDGPLTMAFVGLYLYEPNRDAARLLAREVLPRVRSIEPEARLHLVGRDDGMLDDLRGLPGVVMMGEVGDVSAELARAEMVATPIRFGSGTRLKIIEALAHGVPVVSSSLGAEGLELVDGRDVIIADTPEELADACVSLHRDPGLAVRLAASGREVWERSYRRDAVREAVVAVVEHVSAMPGRSHRGAERRA